LKLIEMGMLFLLAALWGASFLFMRVASPVLGPIVLIDLRVLIAGIALALYAAASRQRPQILPKWKHYALLGSLNAAVPFCLIAAAELQLEASLAAILNAMTPLFTVIVAYLWTGDPFTKRKLIGVVLGIVGVGVLVGWHGTHATANSIGSVAMSLGAAFFYGVGGIFASKYFKGEKPLSLAIGQQLAAGIILLPVAAFFLPSRVPPLEVISSVIGLALLSTSVGYLLYFALIKRVGPLKTLTVTFLVPVFGVLWGRLFLHEAVNIGALLGLFIIVVSVAMVTNLPIELHRKANSRVSG
jgi:drug/metabolite transporter (DMT)-like permease